MGDEIGEWLDEFLKDENSNNNKGFRLVRFDESYNRKTVDKKTPIILKQYNPHTGFADGFPILIISQESLDLLNEKLLQKYKTTKKDLPLEMERFRPNIVIHTVDDNSKNNAHIEDDWKSIQIGDHTIIHITVPCSRCSMPCNNMKLGIRDKAFNEPSDILQTYRLGSHLGYDTFFHLNPSQWFFGVNAVPTTFTSTPIFVGDIVTPRSYTPQERSQDIDMISRT
ncbi:hypothetical protein RFI_28438 [Reticulomyxa filosa]|uniref:MOSC domain-containing protein n=1 Tax=Reticulomyxa filosa TaxID=46433 RepID=X6M663_RETFI|nr:hypothetical protein RFI_28438 [Reticulomyxa filosa]|eukprot:ETO08947.1 hypothetical protein RFI_28438 [Reticulomyxa filosa]